MKLTVLIAGLVLGACQGLAAAEVRGGAVIENDLPSVETVMDHGVTAVGGREALDKIKTLHIVFNMEAMGPKVQMDCSWSRKGGRLVKMSNAMGEMVSGTDGTTAWRKAPMGYTVLENKDLLGMAEMHMEIVDPTTRDKEDMTDLKVVAKESFDGKECYKLSYMKKGKPGFVFFDAASGLPVGYTERDGESTNKGTLGDWKAVNGVKFFHSLKFESTGGGKKSGPPNGEVKVEKIEVNTPDESAFALPEEVKKLGPGKKVDGTASGDEIKLEDLSKEDQREAKQMMQSLGQMDVKMLKQMESNMGMGIDHMPENKKQLMKFYVQEIKKEVAKRG